MDEICRFCLKNIGENENHFFINQDIKNKFFNVTQHELVFLESDTNTVCELCLRSLEIANTVKVLFLENQKKFIVIEKNEESFDEPESITELEPNIKQEAVSENLTINFINVKPEKPNKKKTIKITKVESITATPKKSAKDKKKQPKKKHQCDICLKYYSSAYSLKEHQQTHLKKSKKEFKCDVCSKIFKQSTALKRHELLHDPNFLQNSIKCPHCERRYSSPAGLHSHMLQHKSPRFTCDLCGKPYFNKFGLMYHIKSLHLNERTSVCPHCPKSFIKNSHLTSHIKTEHENRKYLCGYSKCKREFTRRETCRTHILLIHTEIEAKNIDKIIQEV